MSISLVINKNSKKIWNLEKQVENLQPSLQDTITKREQLEKVVHKRGKKIAKIDNQLKKHNNLSNENEKFSKNSQVLGFEGMKAMHLQKQTEFMLLELVS